MQFILFYRFYQLTERKVFILLCCVQTFLQTYQEKKRVEEEMLIKKHFDRKKAFNLTNISNFRTIQPITIEHMKLQESFNFFIKVKESLIQMFNKSFNTQNQQRRSKIFRMFSQNQNIIPIEESKQNENENNNDDQKQPFITNIFNSTSLSSTIPPVDLMAVSSFPGNFSQMLQNQTKKTRHKFRPLIQSSDTKIKVKPKINKYQCRKKQEMKLFLQLDEKTEHLQNFRSDQGKFFKFNENLKIMIKNVNLCRIVLINKKSIILEQLQRLTIEDTVKTGEADVNVYKRQQSLQNDNRSSQATTIDQQKKSNGQVNIFQLFQNLLSVPQKPPAQALPPVLKEKAIRIHNYFSQCSKLFSLLEHFLLQFIKADKGYQNYLKENRQKNKLKVFHQDKESQKQKLYNQFVDKCFHVSEITRLYFNALNQMSHLNISFKEVKLFNKQELQKQNKLLIELRYVLMYLQKQCQNTAQSSIFKKKQNNLFTNTISKVPQINGLLTQQISPRGAQIPSRQNNPALQKRNSKQVKNLFRKSISQQSRLTRKSANNALNSILFKSISQLIPSATDSKFYPNKQKKNEPKVSENKQIDMNQLWKTFYNKKFSNNAMRLRLF